MTTTFAIGDVHGCLEKLDALLKACQCYQGTCIDDQASPRFVFLGDYVDRGPDSKGVIDRIVWMRHRAAAKSSP